MGGILYSKRGLAESDTPDHGTPLLRAAAKTKQHMIADKLDSRNRWIVLFVSP